MWRTEFKMDRFEFIIPSLKIGCAKSHLTWTMMIASYTNDEDHHHDYDRIVHEWWWWPSWWSLHRTRMKMIVTRMMITLYTYEDDRHHDMMIAEWKLAKWKCKWLSCRRGRGLGSGSRGHPVAEKGGRTTLSWGNHVGFCLWGGQWHFCLILLEIEMKDRKSGGEECLFWADRTLVRSWRRGWSLGQVAVTHGELLVVTVHFQTRRNDSFLPGWSRLGACSGGRMEASDSKGSNLLIHQILIFNILIPQVRHADPQSYVLCWSTIFSKWSAMCWANSLSSNVSGALSPFQCKPQCS